MGKGKGKILSVALVSLVTVSLAAASSAADGRLKAGQSIQRIALRSGTGGHMSYVLYVPREYFERRSSVWPLIVFLHGSLQRGDDTTVLGSETILAFASRNEGFPFIIVAPQCPEGWIWAPPILKRCLIRSKHPFG
jgi:predicted peptidase